MGENSFGLSVPAEIAVEEGFEAGQEHVIKEDDDEAEAIFEVHGPSE
ncbi:MAG: hypothetical protein ABEJ58_06875 [Halodesulfurarchaeum sp.]